MPDQPSTQDGFTAQANELELEKHRLENEKLRREIRQESLAWWKRPGYIGGVTPLLLATLGFASAWGTGFFDTQRAKLKNEVKDLQQQQVELRNQNQQLNAEIQTTIDQAYLSLKVAVAEATYAFGHLRGTGPALSAEERKSVEQATRALSPPVRGLVDRLLQANDMARMIVPITEKELLALNQRLSSIPASKWALELQPEIGPGPMMRAPDGRIYDPVGRKFYPTQKDFEKR